MPPARGVWLREMLRHPQVPRWDCKTHPEFRTTPRAAPEAVEHMKTEHEIQGSDEEVGAQAKQLLRHMMLHSLFTSCSLCGTQELYGHGLLRHITRHLQRIALMSLPAIGEKAVRVPKARDPDDSETSWGDSSDEDEGDEDSESEGGLPGEGPLSSASCQQETAGRRVRAGLILLPAWK